MFEAIAIIGVGLMGGSIGLAARKRGIARRIIGIGRRPATLEVALQCGAITEAATDLSSGVVGTNLVVACTPASSVVDVLRSAKACCDDAETLYTDAASTKLGIVAALQTDVADGMRYVGSHPLAGNHVAGPAAAQADLFEGRTTILTPTESTGADVTAAMGEFWSALGSTPREMTAADHDRALAATSHMPHVIATILSAATPEEFMDLVATGWRDTTRIAAGNVELWRDILIENRSDILRSLDNFGTVLNEFRTALDESDYSTIVRLLEEGKQRRDSVGN